MMPLYYFESDLGDVIDDLFYIHISGIENFLVSAQILHL